MKIRQLMGRRIRIGRRLDVNQPLLRTVFIRRAPVEDNTAWECVHTVAVMCGCKILQLYEYDANCECHLKNTN